LKKQTQLCGGHAAKINPMRSANVERTTDWWCFMNDKQIFGAFLKAKRHEREITVRAMAEQMDMGVGHYCDIESGRRPPLDIEFLNKAIGILYLSDEDKLTLYDLAGKARSAAPPDLTEYLKDSEPARIALRVAKNKASDEDWLRFTRELEGKE
jgi:transcriptional regulator with XRE-family HTH domain